MSQVIRMTGIPARTIRKELNAIMKRKGLDPKELTLDQLRGVGQFVFQPLHRAQRTLQLLALAHQLLRGGRIVPDCGVFGLGVQFVQAAIGGIPVKDASSAGQEPAGYRRWRG